MRLPKYIIKPYEGKLIASEEPSTDRTYKRTMYKANGTTWVDYENEDGAVLSDIEVAVVLYEQAFLNL